MPEAYLSRSLQGCGGLFARVSKNIHDQKDEDSSGEHAQKASECRIEGLEPPNHRPNMIVAPAMKPSKSRDANSCGSSLMPSAVDR